VIRDSLEAAAPRPQTPYYNEVSGGIQRVYHPPSRVRPEVTGPQAAELIRAVLRKEELLWGRRPADAATRKPPGV